MNNSLNKKLSELLGKVDEKVLQAKLNAAMEMLQKGDTEELVKQIGKVDKQELINKINDFDEESFKKLKIDKDEIKNKISDTDLDNFKTLIGEHGDEIISKIKDIIK